MKKDIAIFWFRRDLRLEDNVALFNALNSGYLVLPLFIFDFDILSKLENRKDRRVDFIHQVLENLNESLKPIGSQIYVKYGIPLQIWKQLVEEYNVKEVYVNHDYEKYGIERDKSISSFCNEKGIIFKSFKDQCIFENKEIVSNSQTPYTVFTPYSKKWKETLHVSHYESFKSENYLNNFFKYPSIEIITLEEMSFEKTDIQFEKPLIDESKVASYAANRDFPSINGTTKLSMHLRFGTISIRNCVRKALNYNETWLNELIWRDFYMSIVANFPQINLGKAFKANYDKIKWSKNENEFQKWCEGKTGFPIVDAGMRELNATGFMHNRVRMITASFLCKNLLIDWRWGEAYFASKLNDFDFSANNGGWQWASGSGCDAAPYFRIFNPSLQAQRFDKHLDYIKKWIPELNTLDYPMPMVDHKLAREKALKVYKEGLES